MKTVLRELAMLPGVIGSCITVDSKGVLASTLPGFFNNGMATDASSNIRRMMQMARVKGLAPKTMSIRYDKFTILAIPIKEKALLLILCETGSNTSLVATTSTMLAPEIEKKLSRPQLKEIDDTEKLQYIDPRTSKALDEIKTALFETIGPVADMIYEDCLSNWTENKAADMGRIVELLACISKEMDNDQFFAEFRNKISSLL